MICQVTGLKLKVILDRKQSWLIVLKVWATKSIPIYPLGVYSYVGYMPKTKHLILRSSVWFSVLNQWLQPGSSSNSSRHIFWVFNTENLAIHLK